MNAITRRIGMARALWSFVDLVKHPEHLDRVFEISDSLVKGRIDVLEQMRDHFGGHPTGATALRDKPRLHVNLDELGKLPPGTLGREFADHMRSNDLDPAAIPTLDASDDLAFVRAHLYETHDVWHVVTGFRTDVAGELGLMAFYSTQGPGGLPWMLLAMGFLNTALYAMDDRDRRIDTIGRGWEMGKRAKPLFGVRWDEMWTLPLDVVRKSLGVEAYAEVPRLAA
jgi:ubiquinone biosynthesis protein COQ4